MLISKRLMNNVMCPQKLFIVGVGRSGTTLLQSMLNSHPEICFTPETHFFKRYIAPNISKNKGISKQKLQTLLKEDTYFSRLNVSIDEHLERFSSIIYNKDLVELFEGILNQYAEQRGKTFVGDKDPMNSNFVNQINHCFPKSYLIHIIRDPRDVLLSRIRSRWGKDTPISIHLAEHYFQLDNILNNGKSIFRKRYIEVYYERLLENPYKELQLICRKLGIEYDNEMLNYHNLSDEIVTEEEKSWKGNVSKPILRNNKNKWKSGLSKYQVSLVELVLKKHFILLEYPIQGQNVLLAFIMQFYVYLITFIIRLKLNKKVN